MVIELWEWEAYNHGGFRYVVLNKNLFIFSEKEKDEFILVTAHQLGREKWIY